MGQASNARGLRGAQVAMAVALSVLGTTAVIAAEPKSIDGILQFPNVRVVNAPELATTTAAPQGGMRAYKDSAGSELRGPTTEEMAAAAAPSAATSARRASVADAATSSDAPINAAPNGAESVLLDASSMQYSVVVRQADGSLAEACVTGEQMANEIVNQQRAIKTATKKENLNVR